MEDARDAAIFHSKYLAIYDSQSNSLLTFDPLISNNLLPQHE